MSTALIDIVRDVQRELSAPRPPKFSRCAAPGGRLPTRQHRGSKGPAPDSAGVGPGPIERPVCRPTYPGCVFSAGEWLGDVLRWSGVKPENYRREW